MQQTEILLQKRQGKSILYILAAIFCSVFAITSIISLIREFDWFMAAIAAVTVILAGMFIFSLVQYFTYGKIWLVVESDGKVMRFSNKNESGKVFNKSEDITLAGIKNFYVIRKSTKYGAKNYAFGYDKGGIMNKEEISAFPSLFNATQQEMQSVLNFVKSSYPEIELGYENFFQKLAKR